jgi:hypothetical protein
MPSDPVVSAALNAMTSRLTAGATVSDHTRAAQRIAKSWRITVVQIDESRYRHEVPVDPAFDQRIDILDVQTQTAYEFKVSGKNAHSEFYKDVVKVLLYNSHRTEFKISKLVFITEEQYGRSCLDTAMIRAYIDLLQSNGLLVDIQYVQAPIGALAEIANNVADQTK